MSDPCPFPGCADENPRAAKHQHGHSAWAKAWSRRPPTPPSSELLSGGVMFKAAAGQLAQEVAECRRLHGGRAGGQTMPAPTKGQQLLEMALMETPVPPPPSSSSEEVREALAVRTEAPMTPDLRRAEEAVEPYQGFADRVIKAHYNCPKCAEVEGLVCEYGKAIQILE
jgi:hypothetical protein